MPSRQIKFRGEDLARAKTDPSRRTSATMHKHRNSRGAHLGAKQRARMIARGEPDPWADPEVLLHAQGQLDAQAAAIRPEDLNP